MIISKFQNIVIISKYHRKLAYKRYINNQILFVTFHDQKMGILVTDAHYCRLTLLQTTKDGPEGVFYKER